MPLMQLIIQPRASFSDNILLAERRNLLIQAPYRMYQFLTPLNPYATAASEASRT